MSLRKAVSAATGGVTAPATSTPSVLGASLKAAVSSKYTAPKYTAKRINTIKGSDREGKSYRPVTLSNGAIVHEYADGTKVPIKPPTRVRGARVFDSSG